MSVFDAGSVAAGDNRDRLKSSDSIHPVLFVIYFIFYIAVYLC